MPRVFGSVVIEQSPLIGQRLVDHIAAQRRWILVFPNYLDRFVEGGHCYPISYSVLEQVGLSGVRTAPALRSITVDNGKQKVLLPDDRRFRHLKKKVPVRLGGGRFDLVRVAPNPVGHFIIEFRKMSGSRPDRDGQVD